MQQVAQVRVAAVAQQVHRLRLGKHREGRQRDLAGIVLRQAVVDVVQRADAEARNVRDRQLAPGVAQFVQARQQVRPLVADALLGKLRGVAAGKEREAVVRQPRPAQIVGDHGGGAAAAVDPVRQRHHRRRFSGTQKTAEYCKFEHALSLPPRRARFGYSTLTIIHGFSCFRKAEESEVDAVAPEVVYCLYH